MPRSRNHCRIGSCVAWRLFLSASYTYRPFSALVGSTAAALRLAWSLSTTKNSACWPRVVCSITHGPILSLNVRCGDSLTHGVITRYGPIAHATLGPTPPRHYNPGCDEKE